MCFKSYTEVEYSQQMLKTFIIYRLELKGLDTIYLFIYEMELN